MMFHPTWCPECGEPMTVLADGYSRCEGRCHECGHRTVSSMNRLPHRDPELKPCLCGGTPSGVAIVDTHRRAHPAIMCLDCGVTIIAYKSDICAEWNRRAREWRQ
jgi:ribosomal protein S27E